MDKIRIHQTCLAKLTDQVKAIEEELFNLKQDLADDSKSTAGDKHETSRAMLHLEQEKLGKRYQQLKNDLSFVSQIDPHIQYQKVQKGALVKTSLGIFYFSAGIGTITIQDQEIYCLSMQAPIANFLINKQINDEIIWQGKKVKIETIY